MVSEWLGIPAAFLAWGFAFYVLVVAPATRGARFLVAMLVIDGFAVISSYDNWIIVDHFLGNFGLGWLNWDRIHQASDWALIAVYLPFLGMTLNSPLVRPFKNAAIRDAILYSGLVIGAAMFVLADGTRELFRVPFYIGNAACLTV